MSNRLAKLLLREAFGDDVAEVGDQLMNWNGQALPTLLRMGKGGRVRDALLVLIQHNIVTFAQSTRSSKAEYTFHVDECLNLMRYSKFLHLSKTLYQDEGEIIAEELFTSGQDCASNVVYRAAKRLNPDEKASKKIPAVVKKLDTVFRDMVKCHFIQRTSSPYGKGDDEAAMAPVPELKTQDALTYFVPELNTGHLVALLSKDEDVKVSELSDKKVLWRINTDRFLRELRDQVVVQSVTKRIDSSAGNLMRTMLSMMNETSPWSDVSNHLHQIDLANRIDKSDRNTAVGSDKRLIKFQDQYLKVLEEDRTRFLSRVGDAGGGQYVINCRHIFNEFAAAASDSIVLEKFGSKALRIFRVIRQKLHVEESQLQGFVMIPAKEIKLLTYQLMENNFIQLEELRKSMGGSANAPSKCFYLFSVNMTQVSRMIVELCYKAIANAYVRKNHEESTHQRLLDKQEKIESICNNLKTSGEIEDSEELQLQLQEINDMVSTSLPTDVCRPTFNWRFILQLSPAEKDTAKRIHERMDQIGRAVGQIDETLLVMLLYLRYNTS